MANTQSLFNPDPLLDTEQAGTYLNRHPRTLANERVSGTGPDYVRLGRQVRYPQSALESYIQKGRVRGAES